jgi:ATP-dependent Clp protease ATP-binding subunit ClpX
MDGIDLTFSEEALDYVVDKAVEFKLGARGLRSICEAIMLDAMFEMPSEKSDELTVSAEYAENKMQRINFTVLKAS